MDKDKVTALSKLSRVEISPTEAESLAVEFEGILNYVSDVKKATESNTAHTTPVMLKNIMRSDENPHETSIYSEGILKNAPNVSGEYIKVKKIL